VTVYNIFFIEHNQQGGDWLGNGSGEVSRNYFMDASRKVNTNFGKKSHPQKTFRKGGEKEETRRREGGGKEVVGRLIQYLLSGT
jgi:hypothetical protein